ncbi:MAG: hypothetical protein JXA03_07870 [Bacteroidales bacterium]|nr:hypothetical protein [Bacteroidales bacterium]
MKKIILFPLLILFIGEISAQYFLPGMESFSKKKESKIITRDSTEYSLFYQKAKRKKGVFSEVYFEDADGKEVMFNADDILSMAIPPSDMGKLMALNEASESVVTMTQTKFSDCVKTDYAYFEQAMMPGKTAVPVLFQLVNPGFNSKITVYFDPWAQETGGVSAGGMQLTGGVDKSYYVRKNGETIKVTKGDYKKEFFPLLFGDRPEMTEQYGKKIDWKDFATHVFEYDQLK